MRPCDRWEEPWSVPSSPDPVRNLALSTFIRECVTAGLRLAVRMVTTKSLHTSRSTETISTQRSIRSLPNINKTASGERLSLLLRIREIPVSGLVPETGYPNVSWFSSVPPSKFWDRTLRPLISLSFPTHYTQIISPVVMQSELPTSSINKTP